jgi:hypothetical protein
MSNKIFEIETGVKSATSGHHSSNSTLAPTAVPGTITITTRLAVTTKDTTSSASLFVQGFGDASHSDLL